MEYNTIKKILIGLLFCIILFVLSFVLEENSKASHTQVEDSEVKIVKKAPEDNQ